MRYRENWTLYKRKTGRGGPVWYYRTYDEFGQRTAGRSTGKTSKTLANDYCAKLFRAGRLLPTDDLPFGEYALDWWTWGKSEYLRSRLARSPEGKPAVSERYADQMVGILNAHLLPAFKDMRLSAITPRALENWITELREQGLAHKRINDILSGLRIMLSEAVRLGRLAKSPFDVVKPLGVDRPRRELLSLVEFKELFKAESIPTVWKGHTLHRAINLTAALTGCRQGELLALRDEDVHPGWFHVAHSYTPRYGLGPTKTREIRDVPLHELGMVALQPFVGTGGYVFSLTRGQVPMGRQRVNEALYEALEIIGITPEQRAARHLSFHAWRHWLVTTLRAHGIPDPLIRRVTGHETAQSVERYTAFQKADFLPVLAIQAEVLE
jgi:integrase